MKLCLLTFATVVATARAVNFLNEVIIPEAHDLTSHVVSPLPHTYVFIYMFCACYWMRYRVDSGRCERG